jgi:hypothetical protein
MPSPHVSIPQPTAPHTRAQVQQLQQDNAAQAATIAQLEGRLAQAEAANAVLRRIIAATKPELPPQLLLGVAPEVAGGQGGDEPVPAGSGAGGGSPLLLLLLEEGGGATARLEPPV